eukprot:CAMPEP_0179428024 /NCGR_PEP_ID=MMETSP0799-20121207/13810_1 /TAXON_ID=46947 /ORGANISM="Geminigera cryophila, Strain CCMP2564" /LENGTH=118 /DNA_ID=CAMNT_0021203333 /DNA_START=2051 /DNA_END=2407 /DNA_ORIENTATION=-
MSPTNPSMPEGPIGPCAPVAPAGPREPGGPEGPSSPSRPFSPSTPLIPRTPGMSGTSAIWSESTVFILTTRALMSDTCASTKFMAVVTLPSRAVSRSALPCSIFFNFLYMTLLLVTSL